MIRFHEMSGIKVSGIGEINAKAALASDIILEPKLHLLSRFNGQELGRCDMVVRTRMYLKYIPYQPHPITG